MYTILLTFGLIQPRFEPVRLGFPDLPKLETDTLLIWKSSMVYRNEYVSVETRLGTELWGLWGN